MRDWCRKLELIINRKCYTHQHGGVSEGALQVLLFEN